MSVLPINTPSLCIPRVFANLTRERIASVFNQLNLGEIDHIDLVPITSDRGEKFQRVFIHFKRWSSNEEAVRARERVLTGSEIKIIYDDPWFWKVSANRSSSHDTREQKQAPPTRSQPRIQLDLDSSDDDKLCRAKQNNQRSRTQQQQQPQQQRPQKQHQQQPQKQHQQRTQQRPSDDSRNYNRRGNDPRDKRQNDRRSDGLIRSAIVTTTNFIPSTPPFSPPSSPPFSPPSTPRGLKRSSVENFEEKEASTSIEGAPTQEDWNELLHPVEKEKEGISSTSYSDFDSSDSVPVVVDYGSVQIPVPRRKITKSNIIRAKKIKEEEEEEEKENKEDNEKEEGK